MAFVGDVYDRLMTTKADATWQPLRSGQDRVLSQAERTTAHAALAELIWNGSDANAFTVEVKVDVDEFGAPSRIEVIDDGDGMPPDDVTDLFTTEGDSWKKEKRFSERLQRPLHGQLGRGRLLVYAIAERVSWSTVAEVDGTRFRTRIEADRSNPAGFNISQAEETTEPTGTRVTLHPRAIQKVAGIADTGFEMKLVELLVETLRSENGCSIVWRGELLDSEAFVARRTDLAMAELSDASLRGHEMPTIVVVEWTKPVGSKRLMLCDEAGSTISHFQPTGMPVVPFGWTAYLLWEGFRDPDLMGVADLHHPEFTHDEMLAVSSKSISEYLSERLDNERGRLVSEWIAAGVYPYRGQPQTELEEVERSVFDVVAVIASPGIPKSGNTQKRLSLKLIQEGIRAEPGRLGRSLRAVLSLDDDELAQLDRLLERSDLGSVIQSAHRVADRIDFLTGLQSLLYADETRRTFREVDQLHPMLIHESWVFGDEWDLALSEHGLTKVVKSAVEASGGKRLTNDPVTLETGAQARVDLLFHKYFVESEQTRHLVVELKRPGKLSMTEYAQLTTYAATIANHDEVPASTNRWDFWLVGTELDTALASERQDPTRRPGFCKEHDSYRIWVITWGELLDSLRRKLEWYRDELNLIPADTHGLEYLTRVHSDLLPDGTDVPSDAVEVSNEQNS